MRSLVLGVALLSVAYAKPPAQLKSLAPAAQSPRQLAREAAQVRLVIVVSPTRPESRRAVAAIVRDVLSAPKLRAYFLWTPLSDGDTAEAARLEASLYPDKRISHFWDEGGKQASQIATQLGLAKSGELFLVYEKKGKAPAVWMHQIDGVQGTWLDSVKLRGKVDDYLGQR
jgi:hypothetical protein